MLTKKYGIVGMIRRIGRPHSGTIFFVIAIVLLLILLQYKLWLDKSGVTEMLRLKEALALQIKENEKLKQRNEGLLFQIKRLQNSDDVAEERARNELGMIKKGEVFYQIVK